MRYVLIHELFLPFLMFIKNLFSFTFVFQLKQLLLFFTIVTSN